MTERYQIEVRLEGDDRLSSSLRNANNELSDFDNNQRRATSNSRGFVSGINSAHEAVSAFMGAAVIQGAARFAQQLAEDGEAARRASITYREMAGGVDEATASLAELRQMTGNAVSDVALMQGANQLLVTGLADGAAEANDYVDMAIRLSTAMGVDAADGIENFNSALLNMSYARLDTLGIASSRVRERVQELVDVGYETEEAFQMAVLEEGANTLDRLGEAASLNETAFSQVATQVANYRDQLGMLLVDARETGAQLLILFDIGMGGDGFGTITNRASGLVDEAQASFNSNVESRFSNSRQQSSAISAVDIEQVVLLAQQNEELFNQISSGDIFSQFATGTAFSSSNSAGMFGVDQAMLNEAASALDINLDQLSPDSLVEMSEILDIAFSSVADVMDEASESSKEFAETQEDVVQVSSRANTTVNETVGVMRDLESAQDAAADSSRELLSNLDENVAVLSTFSDMNTFELGGVEVFDPDDLAMVQAYAEELQANYEEISALAEDSDYEIFSRDEVDTARELADEASTIADEAERGAEAFANMSLSQLLGETNGGQLGELLDLVVAGIGDEDVAAQAVSDFDMASGRTTDLSAALEADIVPVLAAIAEQFGTDVSAELAEAALTEIQNGQSDGDDTQTIVANALSAIGFELSDNGGGVGASTTVEAGEGRLAVAGRLDISVDELNEIIGENTVLQPGQQIIVPDGYELVAIGDGENVDDGLGLDQEDEAGSEGDSMMMASEKMLEIETSFTNVSELDLDPVIDPILADAELANVEIEALDGALNRLVEADYALEVDMRILLNDLTGLQLSQSFAFQEGVRLIFESEGLRLEDVATE